LAGKSPANGQKISSPWLCGENPILDKHGEIDDAYLYEFISKDLRDILDFKKVIAGKFLKAEETSSDA